jgi:penicillin-binding protein 1C
MTGVSSAARLAHAVLAKLHDAKPATSRDTRRRRAIAIDLCRSSASTARNAA